jgi:hypothetical protein
MSKTDGWYEDGTLVLRETLFHKDAQDMATFETLMSNVRASEAGELDMVVRFHAESVQVTVRTDDPGRLTRPTLDTRYSPWQVC